MCLTDAQIQTEVNNVQNVGSCFDSSNGTCAFTQYCAYHGKTSAGAIYANMPYTGGVGGCDEGQYPNCASNQADPTINVTSHELLHAARELE